MIARPLRRGDYWVRARPILWPKERVRFFLLHHDHYAICSRRRVSSNLFRAENAPNLRPSFFPAVALGVVLLGFDIPGALPNEPERDGFTKRMLTNPGFAVSTG